MVRKAYYRFVPIWFDNESCEVEPLRLWMAPLLEFVIWFDVTILRVDEFKIMVVKDDKDN